VDAYITEPAARNTLGGVLAVWLLLLTAGIVFRAGSGIRMNFSGSMPVGFYRLTDARIERGALVAALALPIGNATGAGAGLSGPRRGL